MISLLLLTVFMAKETPRMGVVPDAKDQAVWPGNEERYPRKALIRSVTLPWAASPIIQGRRPVISLPPTVSLNRGITLPSWVKCRYGCSRILSRLFLHKGNSLEDEIKSSRHGVGVPLAGHVLG